MYQVEIERLAKILDEKILKWEDRINLEQLEMGEPCNCIIGQLFGGQYSVGLTELGIGHGREAQVRLGVEVPADVSISMIGRIWFDLRDAWREFILKRREAKRVAAVRSGDQQSDA